MVTLFERKGLGHLYNNDGDLSCHAAWALLKSLGFVDGEDYEWNSFDYLLAGDSEYWRGKVDNNDVMDIAPYSLTIEGFPKDFYTGLAGRPGCFKIQYAFTDSVDHRHQDTETEHIDLFLDDIFGSRDVYFAAEKALEEARDYRDEIEFLPTFVSVEDLNERLDALAAMGEGLNFKLTTIHTCDGWKGYLLEV